MITIYLAKKNADMTEGRGPMIVDKAFTDQLVAEEYINGKPGVMGRRPSDFKPNGTWKLSGMGDWEVESLSVFESIEEMEENSESKIFERAMAKLSEAEKKVLRKRL